MSYQLVSIDEGHGVYAAILSQGRIESVAVSTGEPGYRSMRAVLEDWDRAEVRIEHALTKWAGRDVYGSSIKIVAPLPDPGSIFCAGANYSDHVANMSKSKGVAPEPNGSELGLYPFNFLKSPRCVVGSGTAVRAVTDEFDFEGELAAVIGRRTRAVTVGDALGAVAGYTIANDLSARSLMARPAHQPGSPFRYDWVSHKNFDGACPIGPALTPAKSIADPQALTIKTWVNDELRQNSNTRLMIYSLAELISQISHRITLYPGDMILTGTPAGVGAETGRFLKPGDVVRIEVEHLGRLETRIVAADAFTN